MAKNVSFSVELIGQPISKSQCMSRSMQIVVGGEGEEPSYSLTFISAGSLVPAARHTETCLTQCALYVTGMLENCVDCRPSGSFGIIFWMRCAWAMELPVIWMFFGLLIHLPPFGCVDLHLFRVPPAWCNTGKCINRTRMDVQNRQKSHR